MSASGEILSEEARADIQGFVTSGFGQFPYSAYLMVEVRDRLGASAWLEVLRTEVLTVASWREALTGREAAPGTVLNVAFTQAGLQALGLSRTGLDSFPLEFREGAASPERSRLLGDCGASAPEGWEFGGGRALPVHVLLILHGATRPTLEAACARHRAMLQDARFGGGLREHSALAQTGERPADGKEPFGFLDGIGQPKIRGLKGEGVATGEFILGHTNEYGFFPLSPVVQAEDDPGAILAASLNPHHRALRYRDLGRNGTFVVYRKLRQDVAGFWGFLQSEAARLKGSADPRFMVWLAAKMVGRWPDGTPLVPVVSGGPASESAREQLDRFLYAEDPAGLACPLGSHIRRTNPRDQLRPAEPAQSLHMTARHRLLRRGRVYGSRLFDLAILDRWEQDEGLRQILDLQDDGEDRGLHFLAVNASLKSQFEFVQQAWANNPRFNGVADHRDPIIGDNDPSRTDAGGMEVPGCPLGVRTSPLPRFVTVRGGLYLFMPSLTALRYLASVAGRNGKPPGARTPSANRGHPAL